MEHRPASRSVLVIGIGTGNPKHITIDAIEALRRLDVVFLPDKGAEKTELAALRHEILDLYMDGRPHAKVGYAVPSRRAVSVTSWMTSRP